MEDAHDKEYVEYGIALPQVTWDEIDRKARRRGITWQELVTRAIDAELRRARAADEPQ